MFFFRSLAQEDDSSSWGRFGCRFEQFFLAEQNDFGVSEEIFLAVGDCWGGGGVHAHHHHLRAHHQVHLQKK